MATRHYATATTVLEQSGSVTVDSADRLMSSSDILMATPAEAKELKLTSAHKVMSWDAMVKAIYPVEVPAKA